MTAEPLRVVLASHNRHKLDELRRILSPLVPEIELLGYDGPEPIEDGIGFEENALIKARAAAAHTGLPAIADDSGISVDILGGSPGIFSARWAGTARSGGGDPDRANLRLLLAQLADIADEHRSASFVCAAALALPAASPTPTGSENGDEVAVRGVWPGSILRAPAGEGGFGYDPVFRPEGEHRSAAQLSPEEKDAHSHRRRAFTRLAAEIRTRLVP
ncbi:non-canonical purine NTP pyrophosphatase [Leucobacter weissii]|uniref:dITP/XTP pyrophosphatase n=1 Tax=Leucobacter weissii TaxID=1983706 RepID=A0A939S8G8_9MICO|nr:non-canonical purine NTP pyrophosphatase [Leucobacter weissii]MBO1902066.1 non-canonical purine NTP pyrophosphatase [Leucobacter weissii]